MAWSENNQRRQCRRILRAALIVAGHASPGTAADLILAEYGTAAAALGHNAFRLSSAVAGDKVAVAAIEDLRDGIAHILRTRIAERPLLKTWDQLIEYLRFDMARDPVERVRVLHLDATNRLIRDELVGVGTVDEAPLYAREVIARALQLGSVAVLLVHNHPSGDPTPSRYDVEITRAICDTGKRLNIAVHDHIIVGANRYASLRSLGQI